MRILLLGNAGAGKTTLARRLMAGKNISHLSLDAIAWGVGTQRRPLADSLEDPRRFMEYNPFWIIEGCYGNLIEVALPFCTELKFLNPDAAACVANCRRRPWEREKFSSPAEQDAMLDALIRWVAEYETRDDELGLKRHRAIFDGFRGNKRECSVLDADHES